VVSGLDVLQKTKSLSVTGIRTADCPARSLVTTALILLLSWLDMKENFV
jgi:hypothetical protein